MLGLPSNVRACLFDLDGVLTQTAVVHAAAWKQMFDEFLEAEARREGRPPGEGDFRPFDARDDYDMYVDGKPRLDGVRDFLESRRIVVSEGVKGDPPSANTVNGLGARKNDIVLRLIRRDGVAAYPGSVAYLRAVRDAGLRRAVVSSSSNCKDVLEAAGISDLFEARVDGLVAEHEHLRGKPHPDTFLAGARMLGADPSEAVVFEDAIAGVAAGRAGGFGFVVGVDRVGQEAALAASGADIVVEDLCELMGAPDD